MATKERTGILARIDLLSNKEGGREGPKWSGYRPTFWFWNVEGNDGIVELLDREKTMPGDECEIRATFLHPERVKKHMVRGNTFEIREGGHVVARGVIIDAY